MKQLIENGLMFGNLVSVTSPVLVARYNRALKRLTGRETTLTDFYIDISGFSPEIADELGDPLYLNPRGVNRQFILLTPDQKHAPLLDAKFSFGRDVIRDFISANEGQLFALTAGDAVSGEVLNSVFDISQPNEILDIRKITIEADTTDGMLQKAERLAAKIDRFMGEEDAWCDDLLIADMITLAKDTGDVTRNPVRLSTDVTVVDHFWTAHFGGAYVFRLGDTPTVLTRHTKALAAIDADLIDLANAEDVAEFLSHHGLAEAVLAAKGEAGADILQRKMDFIAAYSAAQAGAEPISTRASDLRRLARMYANDLPQSYMGLAALHRWAVADGRWPRISADHPAYFYSLRGAAGPATDLVNRLLADLTPLDPRQLFICHKEEFYDAYRTWPAAYQDFVVHALSDDYLGNKADLRDALFGAEVAAPKPVDRIAAVGPWGAVRRAR